MNPSPSTTVSNLPTEGQGPFSIVAVPFHGTTIDAVPDARGDVFVSIRRVCDALGVDYSGQLAKLKTKPWATVGFISMVAGDGRDREQAFIDLDGLPMWLATIEPARVAERVRPMLVLYQREAARVLRDHFFGARPHRDALARAHLGTDPIDVFLTEALAVACARPRTCACVRCTGLTAEGLLDAISVPWSHGASITAARELRARGWTRAPARWYGNTGEGRKLRHPWYPSRPALPGIVSTAAPAPALANTSTDAFPLRRYPNLVSALGWARTRGTLTEELEAHAWRMALAGVDLAPETWALVLVDLRRVGVLLAA